MSDLERENSTQPAGPLGDLDEWEDDLRRRYPAPAPEDQKEAQKKRPKEFRDYRAEARPQVKEFYRQHHQHQTVDFVRRKRAEYLAGLPGCRTEGGGSSPRREMGI